MHALGADAPDYFSLPLERVGERSELLRHGGGGEACRLICVVVGFDPVHAERLVDALPPVLTLDAWEGGSDRWLADTLRFIADEAAAPRPGGEAVVTRLADILLIQLVRHCFDHGAELDRGWLAALKDPQLGRALAAIERAPGADWTLASLAPYCSRCTAELVREPKWLRRTSNRLLQLTSIKPCQRCFESSRSLPSRCPPLPRPT